MVPTYYIARQNESKTEVWRYFAAVVDASSDIAQLYLVYDAIK